jgi:predicted transcriptional regulator
MATITIRMEDELKARLTVAAARAGKTPQAFFLDAITHAVEQAEQDHAFHAQGASEQALQDIAQLSEKLGLEF